MGSRLEKNSQAVRKRIETHSFDDEEGEEYEGSKFGGFSDYFRRKKIKLQNLDAEVRSSSVSKLQIFRGIVAHVNGYTQPSLNDLHHLIVSHGGGFMQYLDGKTTVTHIIAANLTPKKAVEFKRYRIVKPAWIVDSVNAGKLLPWDAYRVLDEGAGQRLLGFHDGKVVSQANTQQRGYRDQTNTSWYTSQIQTVAKDIDDGAQFPSTKVPDVNATGAYSTDRSADQPRQSIETQSSTEVRLIEGEPFSSASFEVTSSLEDALNQAGLTGEAGQERVPQKAGLGDSPQHRDSSNQITTPSKFNTVLAPQDQPPDGGTSSKTGEFLSPRRKSPGAEIQSLSKEAEVMTAEEHNALLLANPFIRKSSTANPDFIKQFYSESRLHHLATWKAELKSRFQQMAAEKSASQKQPAKRKPGSRRYILHVDFDSFFCAVSLKSAPEYVGKPAAVAHSTGRGSEIASCNYNARTFGVKNGMWMKQALKLCPEIMVLPYDFPAYEETSKLFYETIIDIGGIVQSVSIDEALVDISSLCLPAGGTDGFGVDEGSVWREQERADEIADDLRKQIEKRTGCAVSVGIGSNILLAKVALRKAKPAGQHQIKPEDILNIIGELCVTDLPGVARHIGGKLEEIGVKIVKDLRQLTKERLTTVLGPKTGEKLWEYSRGIDRTEIGEQAIRKSVSAEVNWGIRFVSQPEAEEFVRNLCVELHNRLVEQKVKGRQLTMKIMKRAADTPLNPPKHLGHGKCDSYTKSMVLGVATNSAEVTGREAVSILRSYGFSPGELRGLGVQMTKLEPLKASDVLMDGSQKKLNFGQSAEILPKKRNEDAIDDPKTPKKARAMPTIGSTKRVEDPIDDSPITQIPKMFPNRFLDNDDPIDDINSPKKEKSFSIHPAAAIAKANAGDSSAKKLLNLTGTQFILPTQVDPKVLEQLPHDIRSKLMAQSKSRSTSRDQSPAINSRTTSPNRNGSMTLPSQFDPEVFDALPDDMKAELLASHSSHGPNHRAQGLIPQSPRKMRPVPIVKKTTPIKKRGRPQGSKNKKEDPYSTLKQANFLDNNRVPSHNSKEQATDSEGYISDTLDPEFLSALPQDVRLEITNEYKRKRLAKRGNLGLTTSNVGKKRRPPEPPQPGQRTLKLPPREPKPTFTTQELSTLPQLTEALSSWHEAFADDGPHPDDVAAIERYMRRVVLEERDMGKVTSVVRWIKWLVDESDEGNDSIHIWRKVLEGMTEKVQIAVQERGLGRLDL